MTGQQVITDQTADQIVGYIFEVTQTMKPATVYDLILIVQQKFPLTPEVITEIILQLNLQEKICFNKKTCKTSASLTDYLFSSSAVWYWFTLALALVAAVAVFIIPHSAYPLIYFRHVVGAVFVGFLPGFVFLKVLYPSKIPLGIFSNNFFTLEWLVLSIGCSIVIVALDGLVLNFTPWGIGVMPLIFTLFVLTVSFASVGILRSYCSRNN